MQRQIQKKKGYEKIESILHPKSGSFHVTWHQQRHVLVTCNGHVYLCISTHHQISYTILKAMQFNSVKSYGIYCHVVFAERVPPRGSCQALELSRQVQVCDHVFGCILDGIGKHIDRGSTHESEAIISCEDLRCRESTLCGLDLFAARRVSFA